MFGSYTWQIFWRDGYEAMSVLDTDGTAGLRNQATSKGANHVSNPNGLILQSGRELPTWDWLTSPVQSGIANPKP